MGLQHTLVLREEKDCFVNVNTVNLMVIDKNIYSKTRRNALLNVFQVVLHFVLILHLAVIIWNNLQSSICAE